MSTVMLVSGGLDSTLMAVLGQEAEVEMNPLFIDYGQINLDREWNACQANFARLNLPTPQIASLGGYGKLLPSGLTDRTRHIVEDAFLPGRNLLFLLVGAGYAVQRGSSAVSIGLLDERNRLFPDQTRGFLSNAQELLTTALGKPISVVAPLMSFSKADVLQAAKERGIDGTYSCHTGNATPCGTCIACREYIGLEV
ncbi:MAG: 7-cyano-7-deazaguanine synthase [Sulfuritalea sp.]|nr:7-cyano-7-deazaguanine synthase [Sulfuritalea sp.]MDP1981572.1 7-cyano-7-deazaguanine synthase [Sulfuritalea sp.]